MADLTLSKRSKLDTKFGNSHRPQHIYIYNGIQFLLSIEKNRNIGRISISPKNNKFFFTMSQIAM